MLKLTSTNRLSHSDFCQIQGARGVDEKSWQIKLDNQTSKQLKLAIPLGLLGANKMNKANLSACGQASRANIGREEYLKKKTIKKSETKLWNHEKRFSCVSQVVKVAHSSPPVHKL